MTTAARQEQGQEAQATGTAGQTAVAGDMCDHMAQGKDGLCPKCRRSRDTQPELWLGHMTSDKFLKYPGSQFP